MRSIDVETQLKALGFRVVIPQTARKMAKTGDFDIEKLKIWLNDAKNYPIKAKLMKDHFREVAKADAILVLNLTKKGINGYIGTNVLMEMALAFYFEKPIFVFDKISEDAAFKEEIYAMMPIWMNRELMVLVDYFRQG